MIKKPTEVPIYIKNKKVDLNNHNDNTSKPFYVVSQINPLSLIPVKISLGQIQSHGW